MSDQRLMGLKVGDTIIHLERLFTIVNIHSEEHIDGSVLTIRAFDPDMASREQQKAINAEQVKDQMMEMIKKMTEGGNGTIGFGL